MNDSQNETAASKSTEYYDRLALASGAMLAWCFGMFMTRIIEPIGLPGDYNVYLAAAEGNLFGWFYPEWWRWLFMPLAALPDVISSGVWLALNIAGVIYAARVFQQRPWIPLVTFQLLWVMFYGQIAGVLVAGMAWYWRYVKEKPLLAGLAAPLVVAKPHIGATLLVIIALIRNPSWRDRILSAVPLAIVTVISLIITPTWISDIFALYDVRNPDAIGIISLWQYIGGWGLLLWIPALWLGMRLSPTQRLMLFIAVLSLTVPTFRQSELLLLYVLPVGLLPMLGWIGLAGPAWYPFVAIVPATAYGWMLYRAWQRPARRWHLHFSWNGSSETSD